MDKKLTSAIVGLAALGILIYTKGDKIKDTIKKTIKDLTQKEEGIKE